MYFSPDPLSKGPLFKDKLSNPAHLTLHIQSLETVLLPSELWN